MFFPLKDENPTRVTPFLTIGLVVANVGIFIATYFSGSFVDIINTFGMTPKDISHGENLYTIFTSMFLHGGFMHILFNALFLWIFGDNIEDYFGRTKFLTIYFGAGISASLAHVLFFPSSTVVTIGASGAIAGIMGAYFIEYPRANVLTFLFIFLFFTIVKVPSFVFLGIWILIQFITASFTTVAGAEVSVAYWAHIGGFVAGAVLAYIFSGERSKAREKISEEYFGIGGGYGKFLKTQRPKTRLTQYIKKSVHQISSQLV